MSMRNAVLLLCSVAVAGCSIDAPASPFGAISDLSVSPANVRLSVGDSREVVCAALDPAGQPVERIPPVTWFVPNARVALLEQVSPNDRSRQRITGTGVGSTNTQCTFSGFSAAVLINVVPFVVTATAVPSALEVGASIPVAVSVATEGGAPIALVAPYQVVWSSSAPGVLQVAAGSQNGTATLTALAPGVATIVASVRSFSDVGEVGRWTASVTVQVPPSAP
jgi:hypothetical protein